VTGCFTYQNFLYRTLRYYSKNGGRLPSTFVRSLPYKIRRGNLRPVGDWATEEKQRREKSKLDARSKSGTIWGKHSLSGKRGLTLREFALGLEALERFVWHEPLRRVHECVFGVLALESEPIDLRL
jgi:hypothetical protein